MSAKHVPPMALRKEKIESFRKTLVSRRAALTADFKAATAQWLNEESNFADAIDQAAAETEKALEAHIKNRGRDTLVQIDEALKRIEEGRFGECVRCDEQIAEARLKAFPLTTLCIDCKAELESEDHRFLARA